MLNSKNIIIGVTGGIAAYKIPLLVRLLKKAGAQVQVICTPAALQFVTAETLTVLSENPCITEFFQPETGAWNHHVNLGLWADALIIAPCGSNTIAKMTTGQCDNLLLTTYLSARCPVWIAPAMDLDMYQQAAVKDNLNTLQNRGVHIIPAETGELASGLQGEGRMAEPEQLFDALNDYFAPKPTNWMGKNILVTAGPTYEAIDPVRFIGNHSTGQMGISIANALIDLGAKVTLVLGPSSLKPRKEVKLISVISAKSMLEACEIEFEQADGLIMSAAVADYRPNSTSPEKIKKTESELTLNLVKNPDILQTLSLNKKISQFTVGFALETEHPEKYALDKLKRKNLDAVVLNVVSDETGFKSQTNKIKIFDKKDRIFESSVQSKDQIAVILLHTLNDWLF